jgi:quercetin dioxygenase-like cupin family protein
MTRNFRIASEIKPDPASWGASRPVSSPASTGTKLITVVEAIILPGKGHSFHKHPDQEEVIYVVAGKVEQWIEREKRILGVGDAVFIPTGMVHASFNIG